MKVLSFIRVLSLILLLTPPVFATDYQGKASDIRVNTATFNGKLSASENTVQKALNVIDDLPDTSSADLISYENAAYPGINDVQAALDQVLYVAPDILTFTNNRNSVEIGTVITSTILTWTKNKTMTSQSLNQGIGSITPSLLTYTDNSSYSTNRTYTLTAGDGTSTDQASTAITFLNKRYWGVSSNTSLNDAQIIALSSELATNNTKTFTVNPSAQRIWFCSPASFGTHAFTVNGFVNTEFTSGTQTHVNASGNSSSYRCSYSNNLLTGPFNVGVQ